MRKSLFVVISFLWFQTGLLAIGILSPEDARQLRVFFRFQELPAQGQAPKLRFDNPNLAAWHHALTNNVFADGKGIIPILDATQALLQHKLLTVEQSWATLQLLDSRFPLLALALPKAQVGWVEGWKTAQLTALLRAQQDIPLLAQNFLFQHTPQRRRILLMRELARSQKELAPELQPFWAQLRESSAGRKMENLLLVELYGFGYRDLELCLLGENKPWPPVIPETMQQWLQQRRALEASWQAPTVLLEPLALQGYLGQWQSYMKLQQALQQAASSLPKPYDGILLASIQQPIYVHWNHLIINYLDEAVVKHGGAKAVMNLVGDYIVPPDQFAAYMLNSSNLWLLNQHPQSLVPLGEWLLLQAFLPVDNLDGLNLIFTHLGQAQAHAQVVALGQKARNLLHSPRVDEWGIYVQLRGLISSGRYSEAQTLALQVEHNGGFREYNPDLFLQAALAAHYLAGDYKAAFRIGWEQFILYPAQADLAFLADLASNTGQDYLGLFLRRL